MIARIKFRLSTLLWLVGLFWMGSAQAVLLWGIEAVNKNLVTFDSSAPGNVNVVGPYTVCCGTAMGLDFDASGNLYVQTMRGDFYAVDKSSGATTLLGRGERPLGYIFGDLSWDPIGDRMLAVALTTYASWRFPILFEVNLTDGSLVNLGTIAINDAFAVTLAVDESGDIFIHGLDRDLFWQVDRNTLRATELNPLSFNSNSLNGGVADWGGDGTLYHAAYNIDAFEAQLHTIDKSTGDNTFIGRIGVGVRIQIGDVAIMPVPEPAAVLFLGLGLAGLGFARPRQLNS